LRSRFGSRTPQEDGQHLSISQDADARTPLREMQLLWKFLRQLYGALCELFHNGKKPVLRPLRYSSKNMRDRPSKSGRINDVAERITFEAESFLLKCCGLPPPKKPRKGRRDIFQYLQSLAETSGEHHQPSRLCMCGEARHVSPCMRQVKIQCHRRHRQHSLLARAQIAATKAGYQRAPCLGCIPAGHGL
jgi:hypothetical protein